MDMNNVNIEEIVKQVLSGMTGNAPAAAAAPARIADRKVFSCASSFQTLLVCTKCARIFDVAHKIEYDISEIRVL